MRAKFHQRALWPLVKFLGWDGPSACIGQTVHRVRRLRLLEKKEPSTRFVAISLLHKIFSDIPNILILYACNICSRAKWHLRLVKKMKFPLDSMVIAYLIRLISFFNIFWLYIYLCLKLSITNKSRSLQDPFSFQYQFHGSLSSFL